MFAHHRRFFSLDASAFDSTIPADVYHKVITRLRGQGFSQHVIADRIKKTLEASYTSTQIGYLFDLLSLATFFTSKGAEQWERKAQLQTIPSRSSRWSLEPANKLPLIEKTGLIAGYVHAAWMGPLLMLLFHIFSACNRCCVQVFILTSSILHGYFNPN